MRVVSQGSAVVAAATLLLGWAGYAVTERAKSETSEQREARIGWWRQARFGLFIHWGPVSLKGTEISWSRANSNPECPNRGAIPVDVYDNLYKDFNPTRFDAGEWVSIAGDAGMWYVVLTASRLSPKVAILLSAPE